jgi:hypothetical protein
MGDEMAEKRKDTREGRPPTLRFPLSWNPFFPALSREKVYKSHPNSNCANRALPRFGSFRTFDGVARGREGAEGRREQRERERRFLFLSV